MKDEIRAHETKEHLVLVKRNQLPDGVKHLPAVWAMKRKRKAAIGEVYKYKARLNVEGQKQQKYVNYLQIYSSVIGWPVIRFLFTLRIIKGWKVKQYDFTLAYLQADIETTIYMDISRSFIAPGGNKSYCLK